MYGSKRHRGPRRVAGLPAAALLAVLPCAAAVQENPGVRQAEQPLFTSHSPLEVTITAPLTTLLKQRPDEEYLDGTFSFRRDDATLETVDLKIRTRGKYRRMKEHCEFPPVKLNFRKSQLAGTDFAGQDKLKLVTHCRNHKREYEQLVLREFLAYRILKVMTDKSYGVRLLHITWVDTEGGKPLTKFGFAIEDTNAVAARVGMQRVRTRDIAEDDLDRRQTNLVNVFQYLIGNTDYSLMRSEPDDDCCHNSDLISADGGAPFTPLPYDFDFAGLVNASYAEPHPRYKLWSVRQRLFKGSCENNGFLPDTFQHYTDNKLEIYGIVNDLEAFSWKSRSQISRYLDAFYDTIASKRKIASSFIKKCVVE